MSEGPESERLSKGERTQRALLDAAVARFADRGFAKTSLAEIADDAGLSPAGIYRYFHDKETLFAAAVDADAEGLVAVARAGLALDTGGSLLGLLGTLSDGLAGALAAHPLVARVLGGLDVLSPEDIVNLPSLAALRAELAEMLAAGQEAGVIRASLDPAQAALGFETVVLDQVGRIVRGETPTPRQPDERWTAVVALLEAALTP